MSRLMPCPDEGKRRLESEMPEFSTGHHQPFINSPACQGFSISSMAAYYNEFEPYAAQWLRNLIKAGHIAPGEVDERSIEDVRPSDLGGFRQCHFFAGIGIWSLALRRAGWPDDRPVWTMSCPCQPFSAAGQSAGFDDERHLWPSAHWLIEQCRPSVIFGEQVASKDAGPWVDLVQADLEGVEYTFGAVPFPASSIGAPHIRDRLYWVANADNQGLEGWRGVRERADQRPAWSYSLARRLAAAHQQQRNGNRSSRPAGRVQPANSEPNGEGPGTANGFWRDADWLLCRDGKWRPVEPGTFPLAHGAPSRVGRQRAYGNAINAPQAQIFIEAVMECMP